MVYGGTSGEFHTCGAKDTFGILWQPGAYEGTSGQCLHEAGGQGWGVPWHVREANLTLIIALSLGLPPNSLTEKQPVYTPREDLTPNPDIIQVTSS